MTARSIGKTIVSTASGAGAALRILNGATGCVVQNNILLGNGAALELTIARYTTPSGADISHVGVAPQVHALDHERTSQDEALATALRVLAHPAG